MEKARRITALLLALVMAAAVSTGCGNTDEGDEAEEKSKVTQEDDEDSDEDEEEETTKRTRKRKSADDEEDTTEEETEEETTEETTVEETTEATTAPPVVSASGEFVMVPGVELRMTLDEIKSALGDKASELEYISDGYDCQCYAFPVDGALGENLKGSCFFDINEKSGKLQSYGYHFGETGDMKKPDYPYSEAELAAGYDIILGQLMAAYGGEPSDEGQYEGIKKWYEETMPDGDGIWAVYGIDMWGEGSGINEITISMSIPYEERGL